MKNVIARRAPEVTVVDLAHDIPPGDIAHGAWVLGTSAPEFPYGTVHVIVVDPGVGGARRAVIASQSGQWYVGPDNGVFAYVTERATTAWSIDMTQLGHRVSRTFHGRDVFAPAAGNLSLGLDPIHLGPIVSDWEQLHIPGVEIGVNELRGEVMFVDDFGNLISNIPPSDEGTVVIGDVEVTERVRAYGEAQPGTLVTLTSSFETLEIAEVQGNAARRLGAQVGTSVVLRRCVT
jgi:hypothetical protein